MTTMFAPIVAARRGVRLRIAALVVSVPLLATGCGASVTPASTGSTSTSAASATSSGSDTASTTVTTTVTTTACTFQGATTAPGDTALSRMTVSGLRVDAQDCYDRVVIDLSGNADKKPGYQVRYVPQVVQDGSGKPIALRGSAFLTVTVGAPAYDDAGQPTYLPANRAEAADVTGYTSLRQIAWAGSFEGMTTFGVGVRELLPFTAQIMDDGGKVRLVVDIAHQS